MRNLLLAGAASAALFAGAPAHAAVTASYCGPGSDNACELSGDVMVFLEKADDVTSGLGNLGKQDGTILMNIASNGGALNMFIDLSNGFATIDPAKKQTSFNGLTLSVPGYEITDLTFSAQLIDSTFTVQPTTQDGTVLAAHTFTDQPNSSQGYGVEALGGGFNSVDINATDGFEEIKHIEVAICKLGTTGCETVIVPTPEPGTLAVLGSGLLGLGLLRRWRRR